MIKKTLVYIAILLMPINSMADDGLKEYFMALSNWSPLFPQN